MSYFLGKGKVYAAFRDSTGLTGGYKYLGDVSELSMEFDQKFDDVRENTTGLNQVAAHILIESNAKMMLTMEEWDMDNLVRAFSGTTAGAETAGTATAEAIPSVFASTATSKSYSFLKRQNVSSVVLTKGVTALVSGTDYNVDLVSGRVEWLAASIIITGASAHTDVTAAYSYAANAGLLQALMTGVKTVAIRYSGFNNADANSRVDVEIHNVALELPKNLGLIDNKHAQLKMGGMMLQDTSKGVGLSQFFTIRKQNA